MPPLEITDLIEEIRDGHVLLSLLEVLLGKTMVSLVLDSLFPSSFSDVFIKPAKFTVTFLVQNSKTNTAKNE